MKKTVLFVCLITFPQLFLSGQEKGGKIDFEGGIFSGEESAYSKVTSTFLCENCYFELDLPGFGSKLFGFGYDIGITIGGIRFRPWLNEHMFSIGWGVETDARRYGKNSVSINGTEIERTTDGTDDLHSVLTSYKFTVPLTYAKDKRNGWRLYASLTPALALSGFRSAFSLNEKSFVSVTSRVPCFDFDLSVGACRNKFGYYLKYKPNLSMQDVGAVSVGIILTH